MENINIEPEIHYCNCIENLNKSILENVSEQVNNDDVSDIGACLNTGITIDDGKYQLTTFTNISISYLKNGKWIKASSMKHHKFCPFCGIKKF